MLSEVCSLYSKRLFVTVKYDDGQERRSQITVSVELQTVASAVPRKELLIRLTEDNDLFFLFTLTITEEDFQCLKSQQGLLVDFAAFPQKFIDLLELCFQEEYKEYPKFLLTFTTSHNYAQSNFASSLNVIETNPFKHLTHLSLKFIQGSDTEVKKYLASCLRQLKNKNAKVEAVLKATEADLKERLFQAQELAASKSAEIERVKADWKDQFTSLNGRLINDVGVEREKALQTQSDLQLQYEREKRDLEFNYARKTQQLDAKILSLESQNKDLSEKRCHLDTSCRELRSRLAAAEDELKFLKQEVKGARQENSSLDKEVHEREKMLNALRTRAAVLEQELKDKEDILGRQQNLLEVTQEQKKRVEEIAEQRQMQLTKRDSSVNQLSEEINKANEIIRKLQGELRNNHGKLKMRGHIALEQEKILGENKEQMEKLNSELSTTKEILGKKEDELKKVTENYENASTKLEECQQVSKTNENVISWLNRQLNERQMLQQKGIGVLQQMTNMQRPMHISPLSNNSIPSKASNGPMMSTPQNLGYFMPTVQFSNLRENVPLAGNRNKENDPPLDTKYLEPSPSSGKSDKADAAGGDCGKSKITRIGTLGATNKPEQLSSSQQNVNALEQVKKMTSQLPNPRLPKTQLLMSHRQQQQPSIAKHPPRLPLASAYFPRPTSKACE